MKLAELMALKAPADAPRRAPRAPAVPAIDLDQSETVTPEMLKRLADDLSSRPTENWKAMGAAIGAAIRGEPFADEGHRNGTMQLIAHAILDAFPYCDPETVVDCFSECLSNMSHVRGAPTEKELLSMLDRFQGQHQSQAATADALASAFKRAASSAVAAPAPGLTAIGDRLRARSKQGPRHATGVPALDAACRGGLSAGKCLVAGGAPGAGKTSLAVQIGSHLARAGVAVMFLATDEGGEGIDARRLQAIGVPRNRAEEPDEETIARADRELGALPFEMLDGGTVEDAFLTLAGKYPNQARCVIIDSVQTARTAGSSGFTSRRDKIDDVIAVAKRMARDPATGAIVIFTSELHRGSYRSKESAEATEDIATFKESGGIEYAADVLLVLRSAKGLGGCVEVAMPKNRLGARCEFALSLDPETCLMTEIEGAPGAASSLAERAKEEQIIELVRKTPHLTNNQITNLVGGRKATVMSTLNAMVTGGRLERTKGSGTSFSYTVPYVGVDAPPMPMPGSLAALFSTESVRNPFDATEAVTSE